MVSSIDAWKKKSRVKTILRASGTPWNYQLHPLGSPSPTSTLDPQDMAWLSIVKPSTTPCVPKNLSKKNRCGIWYRFDANIIQNDPIERLQELLAAHQLICRFIGLSNHFHTTVPWPTWIATKIIHEPLTTKDWQRSCCLNPRLFFGFVVEHKITCLFDALLWTPINHHKASILSFESFPDFSSKMLHVWNIYQHSQYTKTKPDPVIQVKILYMFSNCCKHPKLNSSQNFPSSKLVKYGEAQKSRLFRFGVLLKPSGMASMCTIGGGSPSCERICSGPVKGRRTEWHALPRMGWESGGSPGMISRYCKSPLHHHNAWDGNPYHPPKIMGIPGIGGLMWW